MVPRASRVSERDQQTDRQTDRLSENRPITLLHV